jgi:hypothetical protein
MKCNEIKKELYLYITGEIDTANKSEVEKHLEVCSGCSILHGNFVKLLGDINKNKIEYPRKNWDYFASEILNGVYEKKKFIFWKPVLAFALSFFVFVAGYMYYHQKNLQGTAVSSDTEELVAYLSNFDIPELYQ